MGRVLPELSARLQVEQQLDQLSLTDEAQRLDRAKARALADHALRQAAVAEVAALAADGDS